MFSEILKHVSESNADAMRIHLCTRLTFFVYKISNKDTLTQFHLVYLDV